MKKILFILAIFGVYLFSSCSPTETKQPATTVAFVNSPFNDYWYQGKAEVNTYELQQVRYGEIRQGKANLIFVTEDFSKSRQVKLDNPGSVPQDAVKVMKLNKVKKFNTGLYPYSMMTSVFTPVDIKQYPHALKITSSIQEWCGHVFIQLNNEKQGYRVRQFSYFESEGDVEEKRTKAWLEDELWTLLRIDPKALPTGDIEIYPSQFYARLKHRPYQPMQASASLKGVSGNKDQQVYELSYPAAKRTLKITFDKKFPHRIQGWEETAPAGWGGKGELLTTSGKRLETQLLDYWTKNGTKDNYLRKELQLE